MSEKDIKNVNDAENNSVEETAAAALDTAAEEIKDAAAETETAAEEIKDAAAETAEEDVQPLIKISDDDARTAEVTLTRKQKKEAAKAEKKRAKELRAAYHVSNWQIIKNYRKYNAQEKAHYRYIFGRRVSAKVWPVFRFLILFGLGFVILYPMLYMLSTAFRPQAEMSDPSVMWIPKHFIIDNFVDVWLAMDYPMVLLQTILINVVCSMLQVVTCAVTGYGFARFKFKLKGLLFAIVLLQIIVPVQVILIPLYMQFRFFDIFGIIAAITGNSLNLISTPTALYMQAFFCNGIRAGVFILLYRQFFRGLPKELEDAAYLDGCGPVMTFIRVMVPNAKTSFLTVFIFSIVWYWNDTYVTSMFFSNPYTIAMEVENILTTIVQYKTNETSGNASDWLVWIEASCVLSLIPILIMYIILQKQFVEGVERSGLVS